MGRNLATTIVNACLFIQLLVATGVADAQTKKVACVGDSITAPANGWCSALGMKLGSGYMTQTFGVSGTTLLKNVGQPAFSSSAQYKPSHDFAPNIVVIMLGTNDSATRNWSAGKDHFVKDYEELIDSYTSLASKPTVFLNTAPPASDDNMFTISGTTIEKEINPLIKQVAMKKMCPLVDVWAAFDGDVKKLDSFDGVHPGASGQTVIGETVAKAILMPVIPGASMGAAGASATGGAAGAGMAMATAGGGATAGAGGARTAGASVTGGAAGTGAAMMSTGSALPTGTGTTTSGVATAGSANGAPTKPSAPSPAGNTPGGTSNSVSNPGLGTAEMSTPTTPAAATEDSGGGCRATGASSSNDGPTAALVLLLASMFRRASRKRVARPSPSLRKIIQLAGFALFISSAGLASAQTVKVACVGDSITALPSSWCGTLSTKLGSGYIVSNFGVSGTNLAKNVAQPYWDSAQYTPSHTFAPNIVIIMLGTNDAFTRSWSSAKGHFVKDYEELIDTYTSLASKPKPYMIIPTPIGTSPFGHDGNLLATEVIPLVKQVAMNKMVPTIDGFTLFGGAMFDTSLYSASDQVHPNAKGQQMLGEEVYKVLMSSGALGGSSSAGTGAMAAGSGARAGSGGMAAPAPTNASAGAAALPMAGTGAAPVGSAVGMNTASAGNAASSGNPTTPTTAGPTPTTPASTSSTGAANSRTPVGNTASSTSAVGAAGAPTPPTAPVSRSEDSGCQTTGAAKGNGAATAALVLALCMIGNRRKRRA